MSEKKRGRPRTREIHALCLTMGEKSFTLNQHNRAEIEGDLSLQDLEWAVKVSRSFARWKKKQLGED